MHRTIETMLGDIAFKFSDNDETGLSVSIENDRGGRMSFDFESDDDIKDFVAAVNAWADGGAR